MMIICKKCNREFEPICHIEIVERFGESKQEIEVCSEICDDCADDGLLDEDEELE